MEADSSAAEGRNKVFYDVLMFFYERQGQSFTPTQVIQALGHPHPSGLRTQFAKGNFSSYLSKKGIRYTWNPVPGFEGPPELEMEDEELSGRIHYIAEKVPLKYCKLGHFFEYQGDVDSLDKYRYDSYVQKAIYKMGDGVEEEVVRLGMRDLSSKASGLFTGFKFLRRDMRQVTVGQIAYAFFDIMGSDTLPAGARVRYDQAELAKAILAKIRGDPFDYVVDEDAAVQLDGQRSRLRGTQVPIALPNRRAERPRRKRNESMERSAASQIDKKGK